MSFKDVISQNYVTNSFKNAVLKKHISHAYIFTGQKGIGKSLFAKEFAKYLFCKNKKDDSCDVCSNCGRIDNNKHPDVHWIATDKKDKFIKIENIREIQRLVKLSPVESENKAFIIKEADRMNEESSNCLLKTLEEPTPNTIIILIANSLTPVKETIKSRCQIIRFSPIPAHIIKKHLMEKFNADTTEVEWASRFCCGSLGSAISLINENFYETNDYIINRFSELKLEDNLNLANEFIESYLSSSNSLEEKRQTLKSIFNCMLQYYRDLLLFKFIKSDGIGEKYLFLFNAGREDSLQTQSNQLTQEQIINIIDEILLSIKYIDYNLNINLLVENIITRIAALKSGNTVELPS